MSATQRSASDWRSVCERTVTLALSAMLLLSLSPGAMGSPEAQQGATRTQPHWTVVSATLPMGTQLFPQGDAATIANSQCLICHSADMVLRQPPRTESQWKETINKMRTAYGAPIPVGQVDELAAYLARVLPTVGGDVHVESVAASGAATHDPASADGAAVFATRCAVCHQAAGTGIPGAFPPLAGSNWVKGRDAVLIQILLHGVQGTLTVNGQTYNGVMPAFDGLLSDAEIAAVLTYIRDQWGNAAGPVTTGVVTGERAKTTARGTLWNGDLDLSMLK